MQCVNTIASQFSIESKTIRSLYTFHETQKIKIRIVQDSKGEFFEGQLEVTMNWSSSGPSVNFGVWATWSLALAPRLPR